MEKDKKVITPKEVTQDITTPETKKVVEELTKDEIRRLNLNDCIIRIRVELQNSKLKKSGHNEYAGFDYFNLSDFLPKLNELELKYSINDKFTIIEENGNLFADLVISKGDSYSEYRMPFKIFDTPVNKNGQKSMQDIQYLGAMNTYYKRYLYINAFGITDGEIIDGMNNNDTKSEAPERLASPKQIELINKFYQGDNLNKLLTKYNVSKIEELPLETAGAIISAVLNNIKKEDK